ncbi:MAG: hypothetical protein IPL65_08620 [Lewinellaceae bacterium]|nr:hypothetical protein [Lewinellaceae bacterium]
MNPFHPFLAIENTAQLLQLRMEKRYVWLNFVVLRLLSILIVAVSAGMFFLLQNVTPWFICAGLCFLALLGL